MAFTNDTLQEVGAVIGREHDLQPRIPRVWAYGTNDDAVAVVVADYALDGGNRMDVGDQIHIELDQDGTAAGRIGRVSAKTVDAEGQVTSITWELLV